MRERIFRAFLHHPQLCTSSLVQKVQLQILLQITARAFHTKGRCLLFSSAEKALASYGQFTLHCMNTFPHDTKQLYRCSYEAGRTIRRITGFTSPQDLQELVFLLYRNIGITMEGQLPGTVQVSRCFFASLYSPEQCALISAMDHGIIAGLFLGGSFHFTERITAGCSHCTACFTQTKEIL